MTRNQVISKLQIFETNHLKKKKERGIDFQAEMPNSESDADNEAKDVQKSLALITNKVQNLT